MQARLPALLLMCASGVLRCEAAAGPWRPSAPFFHPREVVPAPGPGEGAGYHYGPPPPPPPPRPEHRTPQDTMADVVNDLGFKLLAIHNENNENNIAISPYGAISVLVALAEGLQGEAAYEIQQAAQLPHDISVVRVGLRDIHRHLKSYFIPKEGFLAGLTLNHGNVSLNREYEDILKFYGYDADSFNISLYPEIYTTESPDGTTTMKSKDMPSEDKEGGAPTTEVATSTSGSPTPIVSSTLPTTSTVKTPTPITLSGMPSSTMSQESTSNTESSSTSSDSTSNSESTSSSTSAEPTRTTAAASSTIPPLVHTSTPTTSDEASTEVLSTIPDSAMSTASAAYTATETSMSKATPEGVETTTVKRTTRQESTEVTETPSTITTSTGISTTEVATERPTMSTILTTNVDTTMSTPTTDITTTRGTTVGDIATTNIQTSTESILASTVISTTQFTTPSIQTTGGESLANSESTTRGISIRTTLVESSTVEPYFGSTGLSSESGISSTTDITGGSTVDENDYQYDYYDENSNGNGNNNNNNENSGSVSTSSGPDSTTTMTTESTNVQTTSTSLPDTTSASTVVQDERFTSTLLSTSTTGITSTSTVPGTEDSTIQSTTTRVNSDVTENTVDTSELTESGTQTSTFSTPQTTEISTTSEVNNEFTTDFETTQSLLSTTEPFSSDTTTNLVEDVSVSTGEGNTEDSQRLVDGTRESSGGGRSERRPNVTYNVENNYFVTPLYAEPRPPQRNVDTAQNEISNDDLPQRNPSGIQTTGPPYYYGPGGDKSFPSLPDSVEIAKNNEIAIGSANFDSEVPKSVGNETGYYRQGRSVADYLIARYYDDQYHPREQYGPPDRPYGPSVPNNPPLSFLVNGKYRETDINFMQYDTVLPFAYLPHLNAMALRFPLDSTRYYLLLMLPLDERGIDKLICDLRLNTSLKYIIQSLQLAHVKATIPSFMLKGYVILTPTLQKLGVRRVFEPRQADFSPLTNQTGVYVTNIEQAITVTIRNYMDPNLVPQYRNLQSYEPILFTADHPFLYFVIDADIHVTLMLGKINNPLNSRIR